MANCKSLLKSFQQNSWNPYFTVKATKTFWQYCVSQELDLFQSWFHLNTSQGWRLQLVSVILSSVVAVPQNYWEIQFSYAVCLPLILGTNGSSATPADQNKRFTKLQSNAYYWQLNHTGQQTKISLYKQLPNRKTGQAGSQPSKMD